MSKFLFLILLGILLCASSCKAANVSPVWVIGQDVQSIHDYMTVLKAFAETKDADYPNGFMVYTAINDLRGLSEPVDQGAGINFADQIIQKYPKMRIVQIGLYLRFMLKEVAQGGLDKNIDQLGQWIKNSGREAYLRIGYEFDNPENDYDPVQYVEAYRHIVDRLRSKGLHNVYFVWHSIAWKDKDWPAYEPMKWYPGDEYVDWIGVSFFDIGRDEERQAAARLAKSKNKPLMIAESSPFKQYTVEAKVQWLKELFQYIRDYDVKFLSYINVDWDKLPLFTDQKWGDARLQNNPVLMTKFIKGLREFKNNAY